MMIAATLVLASAALTTHEPHGCPEPFHDPWAACRCATAFFDYRSAFARGRPVHPPRPPARRGGGRPHTVPGRVIYVPGPPIYVDAPPVYVEPSVVYVERPQIIVRPSEVIVAPPEVRFEECPSGADCRPAPPRRP